jgi:hypothetical protein
MSFVRREGNGVAHVLSKLATENERNDRWFEEQLESISEIVKRECFASYDDSI